MKYDVRPCKSIKGTITVPGDKSISHRAVMVGAIAEGKTEIDNFLTSYDCLSTVECLKKCGIDIRSISPNSVIVYGKGIKGLKKPETELYAGNSGTTIRLLTGILSGQDFECTITGDSSIKKRPMGRITTPLRLMGALIDGEDGGNFAPLRVKGSRLRGIEYSMPVASAQVKSSILFASLYADTETVIYEPYPSRNHTEIMLNSFGAGIRTEGAKIISSPINNLKARKITVPGDISSAAFFIVAALITQNSRITIENVGMNPTRSGIIDALQNMGGIIELSNQREENGELISDISVSSSSLKGIEIGGALIPRLIDEIPILCIAAAFAQGVTKIADASELKFKESNRIDSMVSNLKLIGAEVEGTDDGLIIYGGRKLHGSVVDSYGDHRIAMAMAVAGLGISDSICIQNSDCISISFPNFFDVLEKVIED